MDFDEYEKIKSAHWKFCCAFIRTTRKNLLHKDHEKTCSRVILNINNTNMKNLETNLPHIGKNTEVQKTSNKLKHFKKLYYTIEKLL